MQLTAHELSVYHVPMRVEQQTGERAYHYHAAHVNHFFGCWTQDCDQDGCFPGMASHPDPRGLFPGVCRTCAVVRYRNLSTSYVRGKKEPCVKCNVPAVITCNMGSNINKRFGFSNRHGGTLCRPCFKSLPDIWSGKWRPTYSNGVLDVFQKHLTAIAANPGSVPWDDLVRFLKANAWTSGVGYPGMLLASGLNTG